MGEATNLQIMGSEAAQPGCCLTAPELAARTADWERLAAGGLIEAGHDSKTLVLRYRRDPEIEAVLRYLVEQEKRCCTELGFEISTGADDLSLQITGPWQETPWSQIVSHQQPARFSGDIREFVEERYAAIARGLSLAGKGSNQSCAAAGQSGCGASYDPGDLKELGQLPDGLSLGCGNAIGGASLKEGEIVLDLGSGAGLDVLVAAKRVGPSGKVYGLDMTDEMLQLARANQARAGVKNVEFLKGYIEEIPLPSSSVDLVISNCVINLSTFKSGVFAEMFRVLKPDGRIAVSDVTSNREQPDEESADLYAWSCCLAGALTQHQYRSGLGEAGFADVAIHLTHEIQAGFTSALITGRKPRM